MTATIDLQPLEWAIVHALRERGTLTTDELLAEIEERGFARNRVSLRARLATLARFGVVTRVTVGDPNRGSVSSYRMRMQ